MPPEHRLQVAGGARHRRVISLLPKTIRRPLTLVVYALRQEPRRASVRDHLWAIKRYGNCDVAYFNAGLFPRVPASITKAPWDVVVLHTTLLNTVRWFPERTARLARVCAPLGRLGRIRAALPQDDFIRSDAVAEFMEELRVTHVFTPVPLSECKKVYRRMDLDRVRFEPALTGYLDEAEVDRMAQAAVESPERDIDIGYRAWHAEPWLGRQGQLKTRIAEVFRERATEFGLNVDISTRDEDKLYGDDWNRFLTRSKYTLGVESGASVLDHDGSVAACSDQHLKANPQASFEEVEAACFPGRDGELALAVLSPRHLEACAARTCQVLVRGEYSGILQAGRHYLAVEPDFSNLPEVLETLRRDDRRADIVEAAYRDIVASGQWTYGRLVDEVLAQADAPGALSAPQARRAKVGLRVARGLELISAATLRIVARTVLPLAAVVRKRLRG
jgi:hypothetical protein